MMLVILPSRSKFEASKVIARGKMSFRAGAPFTVEIVRVFRRALSQRARPSSSRWAVAYAGYESRRKEESNSQYLRR